MTRNTWTPSLTLPPIPIFPRLLLTLPPLKSPLNLPSLPSPPMSRSPRLTLLICPAKAKVSLPTSSRSTRLMSPRSLVKLMSPRPRSQRMLRPRRPRARRLMRVPKTRKSLLPRRSARPRNSLESLPTLRRRASLPTPPSSLLLRR